MSNHSDGWLTIREASLALGVSELTVRRRIKDGRLAHRLENGKYFVNLDLAAPGERMSKPEPESNGASGVDGSMTLQADRALETAMPSSLPFNLDALFAEQARLAEHAGRASQLEEQLRQTEERHAVLQETVVSLAARNGWLESKLDEREQQIKLLTDSRPKRSWWKRLLAIDGAVS